MSSFIQYTDKQESVITFPSFHENLNTVEDIVQIIHAERREPDTPRQTGIQRILSETQTKKVEKKKKFKQKKKEKKKVSFVSSTMEDAVA